MLVRAPLAGAAHARLNLIDNQQRAGGTRESARLCKELLRKRPHAAFALDGFDEDGADVGGKFRAQVAYIIKAHELDAGNHGRERLAVLCFVRCRHGTEGAAVEALLERQEFGADFRAFAAPQPCVGARQLERALPGFGAGVGEESTVETGALREAHR